ncbi:hypothetical protein [Microbulbifer hydrolyticus]|uniref:TolA-binding protein n=1 Tax=Microbulbifer hydrolyticus TaxID=48074 RepID=A0A6P1TCF4_9GAMM|nr:hypothetical protein [Microbulbifer hydrolyticus]MBB5210617.1 TolA-binding protein [Microbulbifer hydrolyticus]QHQ38919.1 hypothetical protein GTQ55_07920 [Microbulbifer hydrolyticus]
MRQFSILLIFVVAFGGAAVLYEQESRKVKGVLSQITDLQAKVGDMQAEINRLNAELETVKMAERRRPNLNRIATRVLNNEPAATAPAKAAQTQQERRGLVAGDVTAATPAIRGRGDAEEDGEWSRPTVDAEAYEAQPSAEARPVTDPYQ